MQVPVLFAVAQPRQGPSQLRSQHTPSSQKPVVHSEAWLQGSPWVLQLGPTQPVPPPAPPLPLGVASVKSSVPATIQHAGRPSTKSADHKMRGVSKRTS